MMMKSPLPCLLIGVFHFFTTQLTAQNCTAVLPSDVTVLSVEVSITEDGSYWICDGGQVDVPVPIQATFYVEAGGLLNLVSDADTVYINDGGDVNITGDDHVVYVRNGGEINVVGNGNIFYVEDNVFVDVVGLNNEINDVECGTVGFDYSQAPADGCLSGNGGGEVQCIGQIPADAVVVTTDLTIVQAGSYWICQDGQADVPGSIDATFYVESGGLLNLVSDGNTVYANEGADVEITGNDHTIYVRNGGDVNVVGNDNRFYVESEVAVDVVGMGNEVNTTDCEQIEFDYSDAPANGCSLTSIIDVQSSEAIEIFPNPATDYIKLHLRDLQQLKALQLYSTTGEHMAGFDKNAVLQGGTLWLANLPSGVYFLRLETLSKTFQQRIIKL